MQKEVLINVGAGETRVALIEDARLQELILERKDEDSAGRAGHSVLSNIYLGRVQRVLPGMQAAFVEIGLERAGFLGAREAQCLAELAGYDEDGLPPIARCVHEGEVILVQAVKDPIGDKGARLSANVTIPGRMLVYVPNQSGVALSRRIDNEEDRQRLTGMLEDMINKDHESGENLRDKTAPANANGYGVDGKGGGFIVRTAALDATPEEIYEDARRLREIWREIQIKLQSAKVPSTVFLDLDPVAQTLRDHVDGETSRVLIDDFDAFDEARRYAKTHMPEMFDKIMLHKSDVPIFELYDIEYEIETALSERVALHHGGWITIETTEALTAVDVNSGSYIGGTGLEETSVRTNVDAAREIMRQVRLRGIGGLIVIDFIHMDDPENIARVISELEKGAEVSRAPTQISGMSEFGLVEMTRKRVREPLARLMTEPCRSCQGHGRIRTVSTVANDAIRRAMAEARAMPGKPLVLQAHPDVIEWLEARNGTIMGDIRSRIGCSLTLRPEARHGRDYFVVGPQ